MRKQPFLAWAAWPYVLLIALWLVLRALFRDGIWWLALVSTVAVYLFVPLPALLAGALWLRRRRLTAALVLPSVALAVLFGPLLPKPPVSHAGRPAFTAMTFNVLTSNKDADAIARAIRAARPDIVGMQELTGGKRAALKAALGQELPFHTFDAGKTFGNIGLVSRFPIEAVAPIDLATRQPALHALLDVNGRGVHVFVAHLSPNHLFKNPALSVAEAASNAFARRAAEVARLRQEIDALNEPAILLCDCNLTSTSQAYAGLRESLADSFREAGWGLGHTNYAPGTSFPAQRIDYVWHTNDLTAIAAEVGQPGGSDHLPVVARLAYPSASR